MIQCMKMLFWGIYFFIIIFFLVFFTVIDEHSFKDINLVLVGVCFTGCRFF